MGSIRNDCAAPSLVSTPQAPAARPAIPAPAPRAAEPMTSPAPRPAAVPKNQTHEALCAALAPAAASVGAARPAPRLQATPATLAAVLASAGPGAVIDLAPGVYTEPVRITNQKGLTLRGGPGVVFDGGVQRPALASLPDLRSAADGSATWTEVYPAHNTAGMIDIRDSQDIRLENVTIQNAWPNGVRLVDSERVQVSGVSFTGGTNAIYARGPKTRGVVVEGCKWVQDPSGAVWSSLDWQHVHHGKHNHYNGAFFQGRDIGGNVDLRNNEVRNAFNGVRIKTTGEHTTSNVRISGNAFYNVSDNAIEPEGGKHVGWSILGNHFEGFHGPISLDGVTGQGFVVQDNRFVATERPRTRMTETPSDLDLHNGTSSTARFFKLKTPGADGKDGPPSITGMIVRNNSFELSSYPMQLSDTAFPAGARVLDNRFVDRAGVLVR